MLDSGRSESGSLAGLLICSRTLSCGGPAGTRDSEAWSDGRVLEMELFSVVVERRGAFFSGSVLMQRYRGVARQTCPLNHAGAGRRWTGRVKLSREDSRESSLGMLDDGTAKFQC